MDLLCPKHGMVIAQNITGHKCPHCFKAEIDNWHAAKNAGKDYLNGYGNYGGKK